MDMQTEDGRPSAPVDGESLGIEGGFQLPVKFSENDERVVSLTPGEGLIEILRSFAKERACSLEELVIFREGEPEIILDLVVVDAGYPWHRRHHVHHKGEVTVTVNYQATSHHHAFKRHKPVEEVLLWAIKVFGIDPGMAAEFELARHGQQVELPGSEHIGHVAGHAHHTVELDLIRGAIANGYST